MSSFASSNLIFHYFSRPNPGTPTAYSASLSSPEQTSIPQATGGFFTCVSWKRQPHQTWRFVFIIYRTLRRKVVPPGGARIRDPGIPSPVIHKPS